MDTTQINKLTNVQLSNTKIKDFEISNEMYQISNNMKIKRELRASKKMDDIKTKHIKVTSTTNNDNKSKISNKKDRINRQKLCLIC
jgi:hypothetical protein